MAPTPSVCKMMKPLFTFSRIVMQLGMCDYIVFFPLTNGLSSIIDFDHLWNKLSNKMNSKSLFLAAHTMRNIWHRRNVYVFQGNINDPHTTSQTALMEHEVYTSILIKEAREQVLATHKETVMWKPLAEGRVKVNWDAAINYISRKLGIGVVVRSNSGDII